MFAISCISYPPEEDDAVEPYEDLQPIQVFIQDDPKHE